MNKLLIPFIILIASFLYSLLWNEYRRPFCSMEEIILQEESTEDTTEISAINGEIIGEVIAEEEIQISEVTPEEKILFEPLDIYFDYGSTDIRRTEALNNWMENALKYMEKNPDAQLDIVGHTDNIGSTETNQRYSERRANTLKEILKAMGFDESRMKTSGMGEMEPVAPNDTEEGRALNRRVSIRLMK